MSREILLILLFRDVCGTVRAQACVLDTLHLATMIDCLETRKTCVTDQTIAWPIQKADPHDVHSNVHITRLGTHLPHLHEGAHCSVHLLGNNQALVQFEKAGIASVKVFYTNTQPLPHAHAHPQSPQQNNKALRT